MNPYAWVTVGVLPADPRWNLSYLQRRVERTQQSHVFQITYLHVHSRFLGINQPWVFVFRQPEPMFRRPLTHFYCRCYSNTRTPKLLSFNPYVYSAIQLQFWIKIFLDKPWRSYKIRASLTPVKLHFSLQFQLTTLYSLNFVSNLRSLRVL